MDHQLQFPVSEPIIKPTKMKITIEITSAIASATTKPCPNPTFIGFIVNLLD